MTEKEKRKGSMRKKARRALALLCAVFLLTLGTVPAETFADETTNSVSVTIPAELTLDGKVATDENMVYSFTITPKEGAPAPDDGVTVKELTEAGSMQFGPITFTAPGEYNYTIKQTTPETTGFGLDDSEYNALVYVYLNDDEELLYSLVITKKDMEEKPDKIAFENTYESTGKICLTAKKTLKGRKLAADQFEFKLLDEEGNPVLDGDGNAITAKNAADGTVTFPEITYTQDDLGSFGRGSKTYTIVEKAGDADGYTYDAVEREVKVTLKDKANGTIEATANKSGEDITIENKYEADGEIQLTAKKELVGRKLAADQFTFELLDKDEKPVKDKDGNPITAKNDADGNITFPKVYFTQDDLDEETGKGEVKFKIKETAGDNSAYTYSDAVYTVTVSLEDKGDGTIKATADISGDDIKFSNAYKAAGSIPLKAEKKLEGRTLKGGQFTFELLDADGNAVKDQNGDPITAKNDASGQVVFGLITYSEADIDKSPITYKIIETNENKPGYTYDGSEKTVKVTLTEDGHGKITAVADYGKDEDDNALEAAQFSNSYKASGNIVLNAKKKLTGRKLAAEQFTFELLDKDKNPVKDKDGNPITAKNDADGNVVFPELSYTQDDLEKASGTAEIKYYIKEKKGTNTAYTYDDSENKVIVSLEDNGDGTIGVTADYGVDDEGNALSAAQFKNTYKANGHIGLTAEKELKGRKLTEGQFVFGLYYADGGNPVRDSENQPVTATNDVLGKVTFPDLYYTEADLDEDGNGEFDYVIKEIAGDNNAYTYSDAECPVKVTLKDNGDGSIEVKADKSGADNKFTNEYKAKGEVQLTATKKLIGRDLEAEQFTFELLDAEGNAVKDSDGNPITAKNDADGNIKFPKITFTQDDLNKETGKAEIEFKIKEKAGDNDAYTYSDAVYTVTVSLEDNGDGTITATTDLEGEQVEFTNAYEAAGAIELLAHKELKGKDLDGGMFTFELLDADGNPVKNEDGEAITATNDAEGMVTFQMITYDQDDIKSSPITYIVKEKKENMGGVTYDESEKEITVTLTDDGHGGIQTKADYGDDDEGKAMEYAAFTNSYEAKGSIKLEATKMLNGRDLKADEFTFELKDEGGNVIQTKKNARNGDIEFDEIEYTMGDLDETGSAVKTYTVTEVKGDDEQIAYDEAEYAYEVTLQDNGEGEITAQITAGEGTTFVNSYYEPQKPHEPTEPTGTKPQKPKQNPAEPQTVQKTRTGDYIKLALPFVALAAAAGIMIFLFATRRRREE